MSEPDLDAMRGLLDLVQSGRFYEDYDKSMEVLGRAKVAYEAVTETMRSLSEVASAAVARIEGLALALIEARNPGIDMDEVRQQRREALNPTKGIHP